MDGLHPKQGAYGPPELPDAEVNEESGDEEEIVKEMSKLIDDLEKAINDDSKPQDERRRYLKKVKFYKIKFLLNKYYFDPYYMDHMLNSKNIIKIYKYQKEFAMLQEKASRVVAAAEGDDLLFGNDSEATDSDSSTRMN